MKLIQLNIWAGKLQYQIPDFFNQEKPDIVCMQEVCNLKGSSGALFAPLDEIKEASHFAHSFMAPTYSWRYMQRELEYGNAILSHSPLFKPKIVFTHGEYEDNFDLTIADNYNIRNFQHAVIDVSGTELHILNHHGYHIKGTKEGDEETLRQMNIIADYIGKLSGPIILTGDFNLAPDSDSIAVLSNKLTNLSVKYNLASTYTMFNSNNVVCDYIFVNDQVTVEQFYASDALVSDHKPLSLEFSV